MKFVASLVDNSVRFDQDTDTHLVLTVTAPKDVGSQRPSLCVVPVVDVSGSMAGDKLAYAKLSCQKLIENLRPGDYCGIITFDDQVHTVVPPQRITAENKALFLNAVQRLKTGGSTNFSGGLLEALQRVNSLDLPLEILCRVIMFTDGQPNVGIAVKSEDIIKLLMANAGRVSVSAFGYGTDAAQDFLAAFSEQGKGNYAFISEPDGALAAFGRELGGLLSVVATNLEITVKANSTHHITSVVSDVPHENEIIGGEATLRLSDIYAEEVRHLVVAVKLKEQKQAFPRPVNALEATLVYDSLDSTGKVSRSTIETKIKAHFVKEGEEQKTQDPALKRIVDLAQLAQAQKKAEEAVAKGDFSEAMNLFSPLLRTSSLDLPVVQNLAASYADSKSYQQTAGYRHSMRRGNVRGMGVVSYDEQAAQDLRSAQVSLTNSLQDQTAAHFVDGNDAAVDLIVEPHLPNPVIITTK